MYLRRIPTKEMTQEELDKLLEHKNIKGGVNVSPYTNLTSIKFFPANSVFGNGCEFGRYSDFEDCIFNNDCEFDKNSTFTNCKFGDRCKFNEDITITNCKFGDGCITRDESLANTHKELEYKTEKEEREKEREFVNMWIKVHEEDAPTRLMINTIVVALLILVVIYFSSR